MGAYNLPLMGQLALGFRSLLIKAAVFVAMASLLAWALGGTLWPRPQVARLQAVEFAGGTWHWQLAVGGARSEPSWVRWTMMFSDGADAAATSADERRWIEPAGPVVTSERLYYGGCETDRWLLIEVDAAGARVVHELPDRLAVEQQLERLRNGLPVQPATVIEQQRGKVLNPASDQ